MMGRQSLGRRALRRGSRRSSGQAIHPHFSDAFIYAVRDIEVANRVPGQPKESHAEQAVDRRTTVSAEGREAIEIKPSDQNGDRAIGIDLLNLTLGTHHIKPSASKRSNDSRTFGSHVNSERSRRIVKHSPSRIAVARNRMDDALRIDLANAVVSDVIDVQASISVHRYSRGIQWSAGRGTAIAVSVVAEHPIAGDGGDDAVADLTNPVVLSVGNVDIAFHINRDPAQIGAQGRISREAAVTDIAVAVVTEPRESVAGKCGNDAIGVDFADANVVCVRDVDVSCLIGRDVKRSIQLCIDRGTVITTKTRGSI